MQGVWDFFASNPEAMATLLVFAIGGLLGFIAFLFTQWRTRTKPHYLACEEKARTSLEVIEEAREETEIRYGGSKVDRLALEKLRLFNLGPKVLEGVNFTVRLNPEVKIVGVSPCKILPEGDGEIVFPWQEQPLNQNEKIFHVHYLNPFKPYKQEVIIDLICDGEITNLSVSGGGPGWSVKFWSLEEKKRLRERLALITPAYGVIFLIVLLAPPVFGLKVGAWFVVWGWPVFFVVAIIVEAVARWIYQRRYGVSL